MKNEVERPFVNDNYWLLFVFHAYWDKSAMVTDEGMKKLPMGAGSAELVSVKSSRKPAVTRPATPGTSTLAKTIASSTLFFHHGGTVKPSLVNASWVGYKRQVLC